MLRADQEVAQRFEIAEPYEYATNLAGAGPGIDELARCFLGHLDTPQFQQYNMIVVFAHSMGGLLARRAALNELQGPGALRLRRILAFATPHLGSALSPRLGNQDRDLAIGSDFMSRLGRDWAEAEADRHIEVRHVVAGGDGVVGEWSSTAGFRNRDFDFVAEADHRSLVKPVDRFSASFERARSFLLAQNQPGHRAVEKKHYEQPYLRLPLLAPAAWSTENASRLYFGSRSVPLFGREGELQRLGSFLSGADPLRWLVIQGPGGAGKSRLALELCLSQREGWYAGFLPDAERERDWLRWQPLVPTLIVLDYATKDSARTRTLLHALASRTMPEALYPLACPVRVLLLLREADERSLLEDIVARGDAEHALRQTGELKRPMKLGALSDPWPLFEAAYQAAHRSLPERAHTLQALARLDAQERPLFALMLADAMILASSKGSPELQSFDTGLLMDEVIRRWRTKFWRPACEAAGLGSGRAEETLLALATLSGGLPLQHGRVPEVPIPGLLPSWNPHLHPDLFAAMTGREPPRTEVLPLEPDLVGEHFVLSELSQKSTAECQALMAVAWRANPLGSAAFLDRLSQTLRQDSLFEYQGGARTAMALLFQAPPDSGTLAWALLGVNLLARLSAQFPTETWQLARHMHQVARVADEAALWEQWAKGAVNLLNDLGSRDPQAARALLDEMAQAAKARDEAALWEQRAKGAFNLLNDLRSRDPQAARALLDEMAQAAKARDEAALWELWAQAAVNLLNDLGSRDPQAARALLDEMAQAAKARDEAALWELWAQAAVNLLNDLGSRDPQAARALLDEMAQAAKARDEAALWEQWAQAAFNLLNDLRSRDPQAARALLEEMARVAESRDEIVLQEIWAVGARNFIAEFGQTGPELLESHLVDWGRRYPKCMEALIRLMKG
nr:hypothetical protein [Paucibacter sp. B51]